MAYASVISLAQTIEQILNHDHQNPSTSPVLEIVLRILKRTYTSPPHDEKEDIKSLHKHIIFLQTFLEESPDEAANLEGRIRDISNGADDIIGTFISKRLRSYYVSESDSVPGTIKYDFQKLSRKLRKVTQEVGSVVEEVVAIKNTTRIKSDMQLNDSSSPVVAAGGGGGGGPSSKTAPSTDGKDHVMVGFDEDLIAIKERLCGGSSMREVIPIHGMGGIGKTTLARNAYEDPLIREHFDVRAWVTMSQDYNIKDIISGLLSSLKQYARNQYGGTEDVMVHKILKDMRYLIVVDDIWSTKAWDDIWRLFPNNDKGSRIMLTTRESDVASYAKSSGALYEMRLMDVNQSWNLLQEKVFKKEQCPPELLEIGRMIAKSCRGLLLATVVVAGILSRVDKTRATWEEVAKHVKSDVTNDEQFARILSLSYTHLPHYLRSCFLYLGAFPEDSDIRVSKLIKLWTAEGFMATRGSKNSEDVLEEYLEDLVQRSLVLVSGRKSNGKIKCCVIHDLLRDLSIRKAEEEKLLRHVRGKYTKKIHFPSMIKEQRRVSMPPSYNFPSACWVFISKLHNPVIRTILSFEYSYRLVRSLAIFRLLRVLDFVGHRFEKFPDEVLELFFLRYLAFSYESRYTFKVPSLILKLQNLQTLVLLGSYSHSKIEIPREIWTMRQLRHLVLRSMTCLPDPGPGPLVALENLQTLATVIGFTCSEAILHMIPNLRKLKIRYIDTIIYWAKYQLHNLIHLHQLEKLSVFVNNESFDQVSFWGEVGFPKMLKKLKLECFFLRMQDMEIIGSLPNLKVLKLIGCNYKDCKWETTEGGFPELIFLEIKRPNLEQWITEWSHIPSLKRLGLYYCRNLAEIPDEIGEIPSLELIEVYREDHSLVESANRIKEKQQDYGNDSLQVRTVEYCW